VPAAVQEEITPSALPGSVQEEVEIAMPAPQKEEEDEGGARAAASNEAQPKEARGEPRTPQAPVPFLPSLATPVRRPGCRFGLNILEEQTAYRFVEEDGREAGDAGGADAHGGPGDTHKSGGSSAPSKCSPSPSSPLEEVKHEAICSFSPIFPSGCSYISSALDSRGASKQGSASSSCWAGGSSPRRFLQRLLPPRSGRFAPGGSSSAPNGGSVPSAGPSPSASSLPEQEQEGLGRLAPGGGDHPAGVPVAPQAGSLPLQLSPLRLLLSRRGCSAPGGHTRTPR